MKPCTSNYAVEARASAWESAAKSLRTPAHKSVPFGRNVARLLDEAAALLRALVAEREAEREAVKTDHARERISCVRKGYARGFREGAEKMREMAVEIAEWKGAPSDGDIFAGNHDRIAAVAVATSRAVEAIRALPLPEPQA